MLKTLQSGSNATVKYKDLVPGAVEEPPPPPTHTGTVQRLGVGRLLLHFSHTIISVVFYGVIVTTTSGRITSFGYVLGGYSKASTFQWNDRGFLILKTCDASLCVWCLCLPCSSDNK